jgi:2-polyprenyl-6-methoxyphenol hydroxylase-like FAD-dependent oxidoreductase
MKDTDIAIIGCGLAGSTAAAILGRAGIPTVLIDPHPVYPFDFRVEKLSGDEQLDRFYRTGIADSVLRSATHDGENWIARFGLRQGHRCRDQRRTADPHFVGWRNDLGAACFSAKAPCAGYAAASARKQLNARPSPSSLSSSA